MLRFHYEHDHRVGAPPRSRSDHRGGPRRRRPGRGRQLTLIEDVPISSAIANPYTRALLQACLPRSMCWSVRGLWRPKAVPYKRRSSVRDVMPPVEIYTTLYCAFCNAAKALLKRKGVSYSEIDIGRDWGRREEMIQRASGRMTMPQIFAGAVHVGSSDELHSLERAGKLGPLLAGCETSP